MLLGGWAVDGREGRVLNGRLGKGSELEMGHRKVMRVPMDFAAPLNEVWAGYVMPDDIRPPAGWLGRLAGLREPVMA